MSLPSISSLAIPEHKTTSRSSLPSASSVGRKSSSSKYIQQEMHEEQHRHRGNRSKHESSAIHYHHRHHHFYPQQHSYRQAMSVTSSSPSMSSPSSSSYSSSYSYYMKNIRIRPSERYVNSNYRFLVKQQQQKPSTIKRDLPTSSRIDPSLRQQPIEWDNVECVIIPISEEPKCPICLDCPVAPQVTHCGHFFCWSCLLKYLTATAPDHSPGGNKNWRICPVCTDQFHQKKVKPVHFFQIFAVKLNAVHEFTLIKRVVLGDDLSGGMCLQIDLAAVKPSPFTKATELSEGEICEQILLPQQQAIMERIKALNDGSSESDVEIHFLQQALDQLTEKLSNTISNEKQPQPTRPSTSHSSTSESVYFHQSSDGQYLFLDNLTIKMLRAHCGGYSQLPTHLLAPIRGVEAHVMGMPDLKGGGGGGGKHKNRYKYLAGYVPYGATFYLCELDLSKVVSDAVLAQFGNEILIRKEAREQKLEREEFESRSAARRNSLDEGYGLWMEQERESMSCSADLSLHSSSYVEEGVNDFPLPPGMDPLLPIRPAVWYSASQEQVVADHESPSLLFNLSLEDLQYNNSNCSNNINNNNNNNNHHHPPQGEDQSNKGNKKGRNKFVLIGGTHHRH